ncbi:MAG TPA: TetR/AcrR family transcriptional regulator [Dehalococcoidia bacterium]|nr:TetR/AcrR family transcriptional regulator [Dehalococcoidia bacterium]
MSTVAFIMSAIRPTRRPPRPRRKLQTPNPEVRERLMTAAVELIREYGFPDLRIEEIVERAGLSVGTFYLYFESKADLFVALVTEYTERLRARLEQAYATEGPVMERLARGLDVYLDFVEENEKGFLYFTRAADALNTSAGRLSTWAFSVHAATLRPLIEEAIAAGAMIPLDPELTAQALVGLTQHMAAYWLEHRDRYSREDVRRFLIEATSASLAR